MSRTALLGFVLATLTACSGGAESPPDATTDAAPHGTPAKEDAAMSTSARPTDQPAERRETATFGAGCFWCVEAVLERLDGVTDVRSGYMGGKVPDPTYRDVCSGDTGHAEVVQVTFDPSKISYESLLDWFWRLHDPTTLNRQGEDAGTQYRSAIFVHSDAQRAAAEASRAAAQPGFEDPIVTEIVAASAFWPAEGYHQDYYRQNGAQPYCRAVIRPKMKKLGLEK